MSNEASDKLFRTITLVLVTIMIPFTTWMAASVVEMQGRVAKLEASWRQYETASSRMSDKVDRIGDDVAYIRGSLRTSPPPIRKGH